MEKINLNKILGRNEIEDDIKSKLIQFQKDKTNLLIKRGFYIYGNPGVGKTYFV